MTLPQYCTAPVPLATLDQDPLAQGVAFWEVETDADRTYLRETFLAIDVTVLRSAELTAAIPPPSSLKPPCSPHSKSQQPRVQPGSDQTVHGDNGLKNDDFSSVTQRDHHG